MTSVGDAVADVVVAGAGHNSLVTAAYLVRAGYRCRVLDARPVPGGGVASEELILDGFKLDSCSTGHTLIQANPLLADDELGLIAEHGLSYISPDPVAHVVFPDGESLTMWLSLERTCEEIAYYSPRDADAYRRMLTEYDAVKDAFNRSRFTPVGLGPSLDQLLEGLPGGVRWRRRAVMSAWDIVRREFESPHVQSFMLWMAFQTGQPVGSAGSGPLAYSIVFGRQRRSWTLPLGGSGELARALVEVIEQGGGEILCDRRVVELIVRDGRCIGVVTDDGERHIASRAVLSSVHVKDLVHMAPPQAWGDDFRYAIDTYDEGVSAFAAHYATTEPPRYAARDGGLIECVSAGVAGWPADILRMGRDVREGRLVRDGAWLLFPTPTVADPSRAPHGCHTVKILGMQPYAPAGSGAMDPVAAWARLRSEIAAVHLDHLRRAAPNLDAARFLAELIVSPVDLEQANPHMWHGTFHGGDRSLSYSGAQRPAPGWAQHRMPIPGLYQTGGTTHPGGSVTGAPGRNAAVVMLSDLGFDPEQLLAGGLADLNRLRGPAARAATGG
ncbi:MAG TPA: NAD(P)/FAD-dependent oxidoreductase [Solirubrobacteraceae bacterium]|jgi:phytoene dehydrogenase-like protein|nr:NAD(P)/FAD-dependent oxidoreductase [Solirubrobacteraceae bacterium]